MESEKTTNQRGKKYTLEDAERIKEQLKSLPDVPKSKEISKREMVQILADEIKSLIERGYSIPQIVDALNGFGFEITTGTIRTYLSMKEQKARKTLAKKSRGEKHKKEQQPQQEKSAASKAFFEIKEDSDDL